MILVGPNEAGKTAVLEALQQINPSDALIPCGTTLASCTTRTFSQAELIPVRSRSRPRASHSIRTT